MASSSSSTQQSVLILFLVVFLGAIGGYVYYSNVSGVLEDEALVPSPPLSDLDRVVDMNMDFSILDDERFRELKVFGELPVVPGQTGKQDPFAPF